MLHKPFASLFGIALFTWVAWIVLTSNPAERIHRTCKPVGLAGNVMESIVAVAAPGLLPNTRDLFARATYTCEFTVWRIAYEKDWQQQTTIKHQP